MNNIYYIQYKYLEENSYIYNNCIDNNCIDNNKYINYSIINSQFLDIYQKNIVFKNNNKIDFFYNYSNYNWYKYPYYILGVFLTEKPKELIPYIKWKIQNIKQRI